METVTEWTNNIMTYSLADVIELANEVYFVQEGDTLNVTVLRNGAILPVGDACKETLIIIRRK